MVKALLVQLNHGGTVGFHAPVEKLLDEENFPASAGYGKDAKVLGYLLPEDAPDGDGRYVRRVRKTDDKGKQVDDADGNAVYDYVDLPQPADIWKEREAKRQAAGKPPVDAVTPGAFDTPPGDMSPPAPAPAAEGKE